MSGWVKIPETWFEDDAVDSMTGDAVLLHLSALADCARNLRDGRLPSRALRRLRLVNNAEAVVRELVTAGWWAPTEDGWFLRDWETFILSASEVEHRRSVSRESSERYRRHKAADHSMCDRCSAIRDSKRDASRDKSVTVPDPIRSDPKGRGEERPSTGSPGGSPASAESHKLPLPTHRHTGDCCPLPDIHPVHKETAR